MSEDDKFYFAIGSLIAATINIVVISAFVYNAHQNDLLAKVANPIALSCAMNTRDACVANHGKELK